MNLSPIYVHDLSPFAIRFYENFGIRWYGLAYMVGFIGSYSLIKWLCEKQKMGLTAVMVSDFITYCAVGTMVGGRLGYCLFYAPDLFFKFKSDLPFWGVLAVNEGGMASHGGILGIAIACFLFAHRNGISLLYLLDLVSLCGPVGIFFGRLANFINSELIGRPVETAISWAVKFPNDILNWQKTDIPSFLNLSVIYEKLGGSKENWVNLVHQMSSNSDANNQVHQFLNKIIEQTQSGNKEVISLLEPFLIARHPSQLYAALLEGLLLFLILFALCRKPKKLGFIASVFGFLYSIFRIIDEFYRLPDAHIGYQLFNLTRGQWLSIVFALISMTFGIIWMRTGTKICPGWGRLESIRLSRK